MSKAQRQENTTARKGNKHRGHGLSNPDIRGSVGANIISTEAGRARKRNEREQRAHTRELRRAEEVARRRQEDTLKRAMQITAPEEVQDACERLLRGEIGEYRVFGLELEVAMKDGRHGERLAVVLKDAVWETGVLKTAQAGTFVPLHIALMKPEKVQWSTSFIDRAEKAVCEYLHSQEIFSAVAASIRWQHVVATHPELQKQKAQHAPRHAEHPYHRHNNKKPVEPKPFSKAALSENGEWKMPDGAILRTWDNPKGAHCAAIKHVPDKSHQMFLYTRFVKIAHLKESENFMEGWELRAYLREQLKQLEETA